MSTPEQQQQQQTTIKQTARGGNIRGPKFSHREDKAICEAYLHELHNAALGTGRKSGNLWEDIHRNYLERLYAEPDFICLDVRDGIKLKNRFAIIKREVSKMSRLVSLEMEQSQQSEKSQSVHELVAINNYFKKQSPTILPHIKVYWDILKKDPRWAPGMQNSSSSSKSKGKQPVHQNENDEIVNLNESDEEEAVSSPANNEKEQDNTSYKRRLDVIEEEIRLIRAKSEKYMEEALKRQDMYLEAERERAISEEERERREEERTRREEERAEKAAQIAEFEKEKIFMSQDIGKIENPRRAKYFQLKQEEILKKNNI